MNTKKIILLSCLFIIIYILFNYLYQQINIVKYYVYDTKIDGPTILMLGGTHGNEPAGYHALTKFKNELDNKPTILKEVEKSLKSLK